MDPIVVNVPITGFLHHAYVTYIVGNHRNFAEWLHCHYGLLYGHEDFGASNVPFNFAVNDRLCLDSDSGKLTVLCSPYFDSVPLLSHRAALRVELAHVLDLIRSAAGSGRAVLLYVDKYHIPFTRYFQRRHFVHQLLVESLCDQRQQVRIVTYASENRLMSFEVPVANFLRAYETFESAAPHRNAIHLLARNDDAVFEYSVPVLIDGLRRQLLSQPEDPCTNPTLLYGLRAYETLETHCAKVQAGVITIDYRPYHIYWEHKRLLLAKLEYLHRRQSEYKCPESIELAKRLVHLAFAVKSRVLKQLVRKDTKEIVEVSETLGKAGGVERRLLDMIISRTEWF